MRLAPTQSVRLLASSPYEDHHARHQAKHDGKGEVVTPVEGQVAQQAAQGLKKAWDGSPEEGLQKQKACKSRCSLECMQSVLLKQPGMAAQRKACRNNNAEIAAGTAVPQY
jgi:hypothetical protein